jgi:hypothetical protein
VDYIGVKQKCATYLPHTAGRYQKKRFRKAQVRPKAVVVVVPSLVLSFTMRGPVADISGCHAQILAHIVT